MGIKIGDIDVVNDLIDIRYQLFRTQLILDEIIKTNPTINPPTPERMQQIDEQVIQMLQNKFPNMGIQKS